jgi:N6-L-threonylcarbamoyladenine synthase
LYQIASKKGWEISLPPFEFTTDNAAMIGIAAYYNYQKKKSGSLSDISDARLKYGI